LGPIAELGAVLSYVRFTPMNGDRRAGVSGPKSANGRHRAALAPWLPLMQHGSKDESVIA